ncbi:hypothetical protein [Rhodoferax aquaticus]|uniref:Uncharacterized protein n=1 Tax=Rhodoferax aquaticus TaxID=2527691 RepID=A0A515ERR0_9BURK|nr:hypothetical protein [Rhodoferax aquaticus]QDL55328.1 hypothetical protein EXZ61_14755 [Rhodoferax aquaticus]
MKTLIHKGRALGTSWVTPTEPTLELGHFLFEQRELPQRLVRLGYVAVLVCEVALVNHHKAALAQVQEAQQIGVTHQRLASVIDPQAHILAFGIRQKSDAWVMDGARAYVNDSPVWALPNGMELSFDEEARHLPNRPARQLAAALSSHLLWHDSETLVEWLMQQGQALHHIGSAA